MIQTATEAFMIVLREGLEALLIIAALAAVLTRAGRPERVRALGIGALVALAASAGLAWIFATYFGGGHDDLAEAAVMAAAALLLFYVSGWLWLRQDPAAWQAYLQSQTQRALSADGALALGVIAFLAVFREGAETILFLSAMLKETEGGTGGGAGAVMLGTGAAALALGAVYLAMNRLALRLPLRPIFAVTSLFLFAMGLRMAGGALQEVQEMGLVPFDEAPFSGWFEAVGFNPSLEALGLQAVLLAAAAFAMTRTQRGQRPRI